MFPTKENQSPSSSRSMEGFLVKKPGEPPGFTRNSESAPSLQELLEQRPRLDRIYSIKLIHELCCLLDYLHQQRIVLRELRPELIKIGQAITIEDLRCAL